MGRRLAGREAASEPDWSLEQRLWSLGAAVVAGVDEAGRGALAGPVVAAAVVLPPGASYPYRDSKRLAPLARARLVAKLKAEAIAFACGYASAELVDEVNVLEATKRAARDAVKEVAAALPHGLAGLVTDYLVLGTGLPEVAVARADSLSYQVAAASILAKHTRDALLLAYDAEYPGYGFARHFGYGVPQHLDALQRLGPCAIHRRSFAPVTRVGLFSHEGSAH